MQTRIIKIFKLNFVFNTIEKVNGISRRYEALAISCLEGAHALLTLFVQYTFFTPVSFSFKVLLFIIA